ncbi:MAG TPA: mannose-1-phosphate guanylyltransferase [Acidimicrobiales bacterium]|nr:mannose-1-phosphate guanylyltransferase [Acidimicrobiales bacterium]
MSSQPSRSGRRIWAVVMAGGSGTRFWPASTEGQPKQLTRIVGDTTMLQQTVARVADVADEVMIITTAALVEQTARQLPEVPAHHIVGEPRGRDTAPCVALAAEIVQSADPGALMVLLPADHVIEPAAVFASSIRRACEVAEEGHLVTFGVPPREAATGYGYLHAVEALAGHADARVVEAFVEKPDADTAARYLADGGYFWNSGIFCWRADVVIDELTTHCPDLIDSMAGPGSTWGSDDFDDALGAAYDAVTPISIDYALMERADRVAMIVADWSWDDLGSWDAVSDHHPVDDRGNVRIGDTRQLDCDGTLLYQLDGPMVVGVGLEDMIVVSAGNAVVVLPKGRGQDIKSIVEGLRAEGRTDVL